jgi:hypothetical protein
MNKFKPFGSDSQEQTIGNDDSGEITFSNDDNLLIIDGRIEIPKNEHGLSLIKYMLESLNNAAAVISDDKKSVATATGTRVVTKN